MKAKLMIIASMLIFGSIGVFVRGIALSSGQIALVRGAIGTVCLLAATLLMKKRPDKKAIKKNLLLLFLSGAAIGANWILLFQAYKFTTVSTATLCYYLAPVFIVAASPFVLKERMTPVKWVCIIAALLGMVLVADIFGGEAGPNNALGILFGVAAAVLYAFVVLINKFFRDISAMDTTIMQLGFATVVLAPYVLLTDGISLAGLGTGSLVLLLVVGFVHTGFAYLMYFTGIQSLSAQTAALMSYIDPITAILLSALLLREDMSLLQIAGAVLILGSTLASELLGGRKKERLQEL